MPDDACLHFFECLGCRTVLRPRPGDCCVFCSYGDAPCPPRRKDPGRQCWSCRLAVDHPHQDRTPFARPPDHRGDRRHPGEAGGLPRRDRRNRAWRSRDTRESRRSLLP